MNDFTKKEFVSLACWSASRYDQVGDDQAEDEGTNALTHKIQDMIDNYCEHDSKINIGEAPLICKKYGKVTG